MRNPWMEPVGTGGAPLAAKLAPLVGRPLEISLTQGRDDEEKTTCFGVVTRLGPYRGPQAGTRPVIEIPQMPQGLLSDRLLICWWGHLLLPLLRNEPAKAPVQVNSGHRRLVGMGMAHMKAAERASPYAERFRPPASIASPEGDPQQCAYFDQNDRAGPGGLYYPDFFHPQFGKEKKPPQDGERISIGGEAAYADAILVREGGRLGAGTYHETLEYAIRARGPGSEHPKRGDVIPVLEFVRYGEGGLEPDPEPEGLAEGVRADLVAPGKDLVTVALGRAVKSDSGWGVRVITRY